MTEIRGVKKCVGKGKKKKKKNGTENQTGKPRIQFYWCSLDKGEPSVLATEWIKYACLFQEWRFGPETLQGGDLQLKASK